LDYNDFDDSGGVAIYEKYKKKITDNINTTVYKQYKKGGVIINTNELIGLDNCEYWIIRQCK
jgi:hypothetical protein